MFETKFIWKSFEEHFQIYSWLAKAKQLHDHFSDFCERLGGVTICRFLQKNFQNRKLVSIVSSGLCPTNFLFTELYNLGLVLPTKIITSEKFSKSQKILNLPFLS
jgi:hypothetical protein